MESRSAALESESTILRRQAAARRIHLGNYSSDRTMTPVTFAPIGLEMGSVSTRDVTSSRNFLITESMSAEAR
jgi:hypothetical protein